MGNLVRFLETNGLSNRRPLAMRRLRELSSSPDFARLPDDLRGRIREIVGAGEPR